MIKVVKKKLRDYYGYADTDKKIVTIATNQSDYDYLGTLIHELIHIHFPNLSETSTDRISRSIARHVWNNGYKK